MYVISVNANEAVNRPLSNAMSYNQGPTVYQTPATQMFTQYNNFPGNGFQQSPNGYLYYNIPTQDHNNRNAQLLQHAHYHLQPPPQSTMNYPPDGNLQNVQSQNYHSRMLYNYQQPAAYAPAIGSTANGHYMNPLMNQSNNLDMNFKQENYDYLDGQMTNCRTTDQTFDTNNLIDLNVNTSDLLRDGYDINTVTNNLSSLSVEL